MPPSDPNHPKSEYDFILNGDKQAAPPPQQSVSGRFFLPKKAILGIIGGLFLLIIVIVVISSLGKSGGNGTQLVAVMGSSGDIARVSDLVKTKTKDMGALSLASTASVTQSSQQAQIAGYMAKAKIKYDPKKLSIYTNTKIEAELTTAEQNNSLETAYYAYLKENLNAQQTRLQALSGTKSMTLLPILQTAYDSNKNLLAAPQLK